MLGMGTIALRQPLKKIEPEKILLIYYRACMHDSWGDDGPSVGPYILRKDIMAAWKMYRTYL